MTKKLNAEIKRLRELAGVCYAGLGAECDLPERWLDVLLAAAEGQAFTTEGLLSFTAQPTKLDVLFRKMQADMVTYLEPSNACGQDWFVNRMIWHMDGPEQRAAQGDAPAATTSIGDLA